MSSNSMTVFQKALLQSVLEEYSDLAEESELEDTFSDSFREWAKAFIKKQTPQKIRMRRILRVTLIAAVLVVLLAGTAMAIPAVREALIEYFFTDHEERIGITFDPEMAATAPEEIETIYRLHLVPDGYNLLIDDAGVNNVIQMWAGPNGTMIMYQQLIINGNPSDDSWLGIGIENGTKEQALIGDYKVDIIRGDESYVLVWTNNAYFFTLSLPNTIEGNAMTEIFLSWKTAE